MIPALAPATWQARLACLAATGGLIVGALVAHDPLLGGLVLGSVLGTVLVIAKPVNVAVIATVAVFVVQRLGGASFAPGSGGGVSYSDILLAIATGLAGVALIDTAEMRRLRIALAGLAIYLVLLLPTMVFNQSKSADLEWVHRAILVGGALLVGAWIVRENAVRRAVVWLTGVCVVVSLLAIHSTLSNGLRPATPLQLNKNFIGAQFAAVLVLLVVGGDELRIGAKTRFTAVAVIAAGLVASQSRGAELSAAFGLVCGFLLSRRNHTRATKTLGFVAAAVLAGFAWVSIDAQLHASAQDQANGSIGVRYNVESITRQIWRTSPVDGVGLKYFLSGRYGPQVQAPNNVVDNELAESGLVGLVGFTGLQVMAIGAALVRRREGSLMVAAVVLPAGMLLHGMVDIYWTAGVVALPFIVLGMGLATPRKDQTEMGRHRRSRASERLATITRRQQSQRAALRRRSRTPLPR